MKEAENKNLTGNALKETFDQVVMDDSRKEQMRGMLSKRKASHPMWINVAAGLAAAIAILMIVPVTRTAIVKAAGKILSGFKTKSGTSVEVSVTEGTVGDAEYIHGQFEIKDEAIDLAKVKDGRLYLVMDDEWTDVTDQCSATEYYRREINNDDGSREVIYIGGTVDDYCWIDFYYPAEGVIGFPGTVMISNGSNGDGSHGLNQMNIGDTTLFYTYTTSNSPFLSQEWERKALINEGCTDEMIDELQKSQEAIGDETQASEA